MATKKRGTAQASKNLRRDRAKLKSLGLLRKRVDLRKKPSRAEKNALAKFADVLRGRAKVIEAKDKKQARAFSKSFRTVDNKVIVPVKKGERVSFSKKSGELKTTRKTKSGKRVTKTIAAGELGPLAKGQYYVVPFGSGGNEIRYRFNTLKTMLEFMQPYEEKENPYKNWRQYVEIEDIEDGGETITKRGRSRKSRRTKRERKKGRR